MCSLLLYFNIAFLFREKNNLIKNYCKPKSHFSDLKTFSYSKFINIITLKSSNYGNPHANLIYLVMWFVIHCDTFFYNNINYSCFCVLNDNIRTSLNHFPNSRFIFIIEHQFVISIVSFIDHLIGDINGKVISFIDH